MTCNIKLVILCAALLKTYVSFFSAFYFIIAKYLLIVSSSVSLQVTHIELLSSDCGTGGLPPSFFLSLL